MRKVTPALKMRELSETDAALDFLFSLKWEAIEGLIPGVKESVAQIRAAK